MAELNIDIDIPKIIAPVLAKQVIPKLGELRKAGIFNTFKEIKNDYVEHVFKEYFLRRYADLITIDTLVLQNQQVPFDNLYFPLTVITHDNKEEVNIKIDGYPKDFLGKYFKVLIEDTAGMGKSTILRKLFLSVIEEHCAIPILIELRNLNADHGVMDEIIHQLTPIGEKLDQEFLLHLIKRGDFVFLFDGYDEIPLDNRQKVSLDLHDFISKTGENLFVLSSRPEDELASFGQFRKFTIRPLEKEESYEVIDIYARCDQRDFSQDLVKLLELPENRSVHEFLTNPLLTSLLYASFDYNREIPLEKAQFYRSVFDGLFNRHDISKKGYYKREKKCGLHKDNFESILRGIGFFTMKMGKVRYDKDEILGVIDKSRRFFELQFSPSDFLEDLLKAVPIFQRDGTFIRWSHKSLQDYFAARFLCLDTGEKQERELSKLILNPNAEKRQNVIELVYYLNQKAFRRFVLSPFLELIFEFVENEMSYAEMEHSEDSVKFKEATLALHLSIREKTSILEHCIVVFDKISEEDPESDFDTYLITHSFNE
ncbi:MAG: NACHT domain-containing protein, partial [Bacteroidota bacterium]